MNSCLASKDCLQKYGIFLLRIFLGILLLSHGLLKFCVFTPAGTAQFFQSIGYPPFFGYLIMFGEILGGTALILGFLTRLVCVLALPILIGATMAHAGNGWLFSFPNGGWEFPLFWTVCLIVQFTLGSGAFSLDCILNKFCRKCKDKCEKKS